MFCHSFIHSFQAGLKSKCIFCLLQNSCSPCDYCRNSADIACKAAQFSMDPSYTGEIHSNFTGTQALAAEHINLVDFHGIWICLPCAVLNILPIILSLFFFPQICSIFLSFCFTLISTSRLQKQADALYSWSTKTSQNNNSPISVVMQ